MAALNLGATQADVIENSQFGYRDWIGAAYTTDDGNRLAYCFIGKSFDTGQILGVSLQANGTIFLLIGDQTWQLEPEDRADIELRIDQEQTLRTTAEAVNRNAFIVLLENPRVTLGKIQNGYELEISVDGRKGVYDLTGSFYALEGGKRCFLKYRQYPEVAEPAPRQAPSAAPTPSAPREPAIAYNITSEPQIDYEVEPPIIGEPVSAATGEKLAQVMIDAAEVGGISYLNNDRVADFGLPDAVMWSSASSQLIGGIAAHRVDPNVDLTTLVTDLISFNQQRCPGRYLAAYQALDVARFPGVEASAICSSANASYELFVTHTTVGDIGVTVLLEASGSIFSEIQRYRELIEDIRIQTAQFAAENGNLAE